MPSLVVEVEVPRVELALLVPAIPPLLTRLRAITFDPDGVALLSGSGRREGLRLLTGVPGRVGARYRVVTISSDSGPEQRVDPPYDLTVVADDERQLAAEFVGDGFSGRVLVESPARPTRVQVISTVVVPELVGRIATVVGGSTLELRVELVVAQLTGPGPQLRADGDVGRVGGEVLVHLRRGPGSLDQARLDTTVRLRGVLRPLGLLWPLVRARVESALRDDLPAVMADLASETDRLLAAGSDPDTVADRAMIDLAASLAEHVPGP